MGKHGTGTAKISVGTTSKQITTASALIKLDEEDPRYTKDDGRLPIELVVTGITTDPSNLVVTTAEGDEDTWTIAANQLPFRVTCQIAEIKATATAAIVLNAIYN